MLEDEVSVESVLAVLQAEEGALAVRASSDVACTCAITYYISSARRQAPVIFVHALGGASIHTSTN